jgi:hypothetical protein
MKLYAPAWLSIKSIPSSKDEAKHLWKMIGILQYLQKDVRDYVDPVTQRNWYYGHPNNNTFAMLRD